jgi:hypothetical protein
MNLAKPGSLISGGACAVSRAVIVVAVILVGHWRQKPEIGEIAAIALGSSCIGLIVGLVAGAWPRPTGGALLGGVLSAATSLATIPLLACGLNPPTLDDLFRSAPHDNSGNLLVALLVMVPLAGAISGGIGGSYNQQQAMRLRDQRIEKFRVKFASLATEYLEVTLESGALEPEAEEAISQILQERGH